MIDFEIVQNPSDNADWISFVDQSYETNDWPCSYNDYLTYQKIFGEENLQMLFAKEKATGRMLGCVTMGIHESINGSPRLGYLGFYYVTKDCRGLGIGDTLFSAVMEKHLADGTNLSLIAVSSMAAKYADRYHYDKLTTYQLQKYQIDTHNLDLNLDISSMESDFRFESPLNVDQKMVTEFDLEITGGINRESYFKHHFRRDDMYAKIMLCKSSGNVVAMCGVKKIVGNRLLVSPLYAKTKAMAHAVLVSTLRSIPNLTSYRFVQFSVPSCNRETVEILNALSNDQFRKVPGQTQTQFTQTIPDIRTDHVYAILSFGLTFI